MYCEHQIGSSSLKRGCFVNRTTGRKHNSSENTRQALICLTMEMFSFTAPETGPSWVSGEPPIQPPSHSMGDSSFNFSLLTRGRLRQCPFGGRVRMRNGWCWK
ncbi:hypothetical protein NPIL_13461 [Nephila pilipes]|uniref:Uncharacterized protein n=1 Tax=Nephila pilipes TaxID=299642 RepID=A0A8X6UMZ2_NEPPI|nr:hypothetical protein NPIL_13461 [Nephila pilipes]